MRPLVLFPLVVLSAPAFAQEAAPAPAPPLTSDGDEAVGTDDDDIIVLAERYRGEIETAQPPIMTLDEGDIASYGAASIDELLSALSPQTGSGRGRGDGRPVILLNGQRISSFREMRDIPPEALRRMQILPEEVALKYGYPANQRVVNFILKDKFSSKTVAGEYNVPTRGGFADSELEGSLFRIDGKSRLNLAAKLNDTSLLTEAERNIIQPAENIPLPGALDPARYRSLIADSRDLTLNGTWARGFGEGASAAALSLNGAFTRSDSRSLSGLDSSGDPLARTTRSDKFESGVGFNKPLGGGWNLTATADGGYTDSQTRVDRREAGGFDIADSKDLSLGSLATVTGTPFRLPAGEASLTVKGGYAFTRSVNDDTRTTSGEVRLKRGDLSTGINLGLPITSKRDGVLGAIGDVSLNFSAGIDHLSDFGTLTDWSAGLTWQPTEKLGFQVSYLVNEAAPSLSQLGGPQIQTFNVPVYDFSTGQTMLVTVTGGGNPDLLRETQRDLKVAANWTLPFLKNSNVIAEYFRNNSDDVTQSFPLLTPAIEGAFPGRVVRDASGQLVSIDRRPVTFSKVASSRLRWGFNISGELGKPDPNARQDPRRGAGIGGPGGGPRMGGRGGGGGGGPHGAGGGGFGRGPMGGGGDGKGRWNLSLYHTYRFSESVRIAQGGPVLDLLDGEAIADGGVARHSLELEGGTFYRGLGLRLNGRWTAPARVEATGAPGSSDLRFGSVFDLDARIFVNFDQRKKLVEKVPLLKGTRLSFEFQNIFDSRQKVTDASGTVPLSYQAAYRDPRGRIVGIDIRKIF